MSGMQGVIDELEAVGLDAIVVDFGEILEQLDREDEAPAPIPELTDAEADRILERLWTLQAKIAQIQAGAERKCRRLQQRIAGIEFRHGLQLQTWTARQLRGKSRSVATTWGLVGFRAQQDQVEILDEPALIAWLRETNRDEAVKESVVRAKLNGILKTSAVVLRDPETGEVTARVLEIGETRKTAVRAIPREEKWYHKVDTEGAAVEEPAVVGEAE